MRRTSILAYGLALGTLAVAGCRDSNSSHPDSNGGGDGNGGVVHIQDIQNDAMPPGTAVQLQGVVVTAIDAFGAKTGDFWVEEPGGGEYSGVHVFGAPVDQVAAVAVGDIVDIKGAVKDEFALNSDTSGRTVTELKPASGGMITVTKTGTGTVPAPAVVDALAIGQMSDQAARDAEWEKWEGVLITVNNVTALGAPRAFGSTMPPPGDSYNFHLTGGLVAESSLAKFPANIMANDCLASVTGVEDYFFDYLILPRTTDEVATGGSACPAPENTMALCTDGVDNDGNGFGDCNDNNCITAEATCRSVKTIAEIQTATTPITGGVELDGVYVAGISNNKKNLWVQTSVQAAANEGIYVYGDGSDLSSYTIGSKVNLIGTIDEYNNDTMGGTLTEFNALSITAATGNGTVLPKTGQDVATLKVDATGEPYESVLVTLTNVKVTVLGNTGTHGVGTLSQNGTTFESDDDLHLLGTGGDMVTVGTCFASITGFWTYLVYDDQFGFLPRNAPGDNITAGGNCP